MRSAAREALRKSEAFCAINRILFQVAPSRRKCVQATFQISFVSFACLGILFSLAVLNSAVPLTQNHAFRTDLRMARR